MRYFRIFLLNFQQAFENRGRSFIWLLLALINPLLILGFWIGAYKSNGAIENWSLPSVTSYYFFLIIAGSFLIAHIEEDVAVRDIQEGGLVTYLLRPFSYFWNHFFGELSWRLLQGIFSFVIFLLLLLLFGKFVALATTVSQIVTAVIIWLLAYMLSFVFKMILGMTAFWLTDFHGLQNIMEIVLLVLAGFVMPLEFYPKSLQVISFIFPFAYMVYFPILAFQGKLELVDALRIISIQVVWLSLLTILYRYMWRKGLQSFTGVGQ